MKRVSVSVFVIATLVVALLGGGCRSPEPGPPPAGSRGETTTPPREGADTDASGCGFPGTPTPFALPVIPGLARGTFSDVDGVSGTGRCDNGRVLEYELRDMNGDRRPDLVVRSACDDTTIGPLAWRVYTSTEHGFASEPVRFVLPLPRPPTCASVSLADVDGDLAPDLVMTSLCTDASVGTSRWIVNRNNGAGFDPATDFALPAGAVPSAFPSLAVDAAACSAGKPAYRTFDLDGDLVADLVVTVACDDAQIGTSAWRVHRGTAAGFESAPVRFGLPTTPAPLPRMYTTAGAAAGDCNASPLARSYDLVDFDGDFAPDLIVTMLCSDTNVGSTRWLAYENLGDHFAQAPAIVRLPLVTGARSAFTSLAASADCASKRPAFATLDVTGDMRRDLLLTRACDDSASGVSRWLLYPNEEGVFASDQASAAERKAVAFALPRTLGGTREHPLGLRARAVCEGADRPGFFSAPFVGPELDVVVTRACHDASVGTTRWLVYRARCD